MVSTVLFPCKTAVAALLILVYVLLDRIQAIGGHRGKFKWPKIPGFQVVSDYFVRRQTTIPTYGRTRRYRNEDTGSQIFIQYQPHGPGLAPLKITFCVKDRNAIHRTELEAVLKRFRPYRLITVELALNFHSDSGVDQRFISQHALFGKSRPRPNRDYPDTLYYGTRKSAKLVRCYWKRSLQCYREELELHSLWLRPRRVNSVSDLIEHIHDLCPAHVRFVEFNWPALAAHLSYLNLPTEKILREAQARADSIYDLLRYLRHTVRIRNPHRFVRPLRINTTIVQILNAWAKSFRKCSAETAHVKGRRR